MIPPLPPARGPLQDGGSAELLLRYEDVAQDGRILLTALLQGLGPAIWRPLLSKQTGLGGLRRQGILPILSRIVAVSDPRTLSVDIPIAYEGAYRFAREANGERLFINMWLNAFAPVANTLGPKPEEGALAERVGRVFAEHVFTRPFAPPDERRVTIDDVPELLPLLDEGYVFEPAEALLKDVKLSDTGPMTFGLLHTDSNQHVNSLVYPRVLQERAVQHFHDPRLAVGFEIRFRKPFFSGETAQVKVARSGELTTGSFVDAKSGKLHAAMTLK